MSSTDNLANLREIRNSLKSGDLMFFQGTAADSTLIRAITGGIWSHCAMIIKGADIDCKEHEFLLFESSVTAGKDIHYNDTEKDTKTGVMLSDFDLRIKNYSASKEYSLFGIRQLRSEQISQPQLNQLNSFTLNPNIRNSVYPAERQVAVEHFIAKELESNQFTDRTMAKIKNEMDSELSSKLTEDELKIIIRKTIESAQDDPDLATRDKFGHKHASPSHYFCSELLADALMHMEILKMGNAARYSPSDLSDESSSLLDDYFAELICLRPTLD